MTKIANDIVLESPLDMHVHFRQGAMLTKIAKYTADHFSGALLMPNIVPEIDSFDKLKTYKKEVELALPSNSDFQPYYTLFFKTEYAKSNVLESCKEHILAVKFYPKGMTTNSDHGVDPEAPEVEAVLAKMQDLNIPLCVHGESPGFVMDREKNFSSIYSRWATKFPQLKIIMEHITTADLVKLLDRHPNLYATVTVHHLICTLDDVIGGMLNPHLFCKPIPKRPEDRDYLRHLVFSAHPKVMLGTDSAPHPKDKKECSGCAAGAFTAPIALSLLTNEFYKHSTFERLQAFISWNARRIYEITPPRKFIRLFRDVANFEKEPTLIPESFEGVVPLFAGKRLDWIGREIKYKPI